jgi:hypothetical protein
VPDITKLKGIKPTEATQLRTQGIATVEQLWFRISEQQDNGISQICTATSISEDRLIELLIAEGVRPPGTYGTGWLKEHWPDVLIVLSLLLLAVLFWRIRIHVV